MEHNVADDNTHGAVQNKKLENVIHLQGKADYGNSSYQKTNGILFLTRFTKSIESGSEKRKTEVRTIL